MSEECCNTPSDCTNPPCPEGRTAKEEMIKRLEDIQSWARDNFSPGRPVAELCTMLDHAACWSARML